MTTLKNTAKPITDLHFPAVTICASGLHMDNVQRKLAKNFVKWRADKKKNETDRETLENDIQEYMQKTFQIKTESLSILDILDTMIAPNPDASVAANGVRGNIFACKENRSQENGRRRRKKRSTATYSCPNNKFNLSGSNCFWVSDQALNYNEAISQCSAQGAELATINNAKDETFVSDLMPSSLRPGGEQIYWIGLNDIEDEGTFVWQDKSVPTYFNWNQGQPEVGNTQDCVVKRKINEEWYDQNCNRERGFVCSQKAVNSCGSSVGCPSQSSSLADSGTDSLIQSVVEEEIIENSCIQPTITLEDISSPQLPDVDVFLNPTKTRYMEGIIEEKQQIAKSYFDTVEMQSLYPELFSILWESTLSCSGSEESDEHMVLSCQLAGAKVNCSDIFTKVPTDIGVCCALNSLDSLRNSEYKQLVEELQREVKMEPQANARVGQNNGLKLTLDLHSNTVSFGTLDQEYEGFSVFIGHPAEFPMMKEDSLKLEPGREHFVKLSASVVSTDDIKDIAPEARDCFFADEGNLDFYKKYTFSNCRLECAIKRTEKIFKCVPWHLPRVGNLLAIFID